MPRMRVFGVDPGSERTGYGCIESDGQHHRLMTCGVVSAPARASFAERLRLIHEAIAERLRDCCPDLVVIETLFHAANARSALKLGHARGVAVLAAAQAGLTLVEYTPAEVKRAIVGYGRAEKHQVQEMVRLLLGLAQAPAPHDAADALAIALCHVHCSTGAAGVMVEEARKLPRSWRNWRPPAGSRPS